MVMVHRYGLLAELRRQYPEIWQWFFEGDCLSPILTFVHHPFGHSVIWTFLVSFPNMKMDNTTKELSLAEIFVSESLLHDTEHDTHGTRALFKTSLASSVTIWSILILSWFAVFLRAIASIASIAHRRLNHHDGVKSKLEAMDHLTLYMRELVKENISLLTLLVSLCWATSTTIFVFTLNSQLGEHEPGAILFYSDTPQPHYYAVIQQSYAVLVLSDILPRLHFQSSFHLAIICWTFCDKDTISKRTFTYLVFLCIVPGFAVSLYFGELVGAKFGCSRPEPIPYSRHRRTGNSNQAVESRKLLAKLAKTEKFMVIQDRRESSYTNDVQQLDRHYLLSLLAPSHATGSAGYSDLGCRGRTQESGQYLVFISHHCNSSSHISNTDGRLGFQSAWKDSRELMDC
ncbi:hypothetical protein BGW80DRAFT_1256539 [Lactifluus volemus]|nr:hypothetical protein BGW80DRAFT_1256539 [Lactifluus volemus]